MIPPQVNFRIYLFASAVAICLLTEFVSLKINRAGGVSLPFFLNREDVTPKTQLANSYMFLDPHLGYAHSDAESITQRIISKYTWYRGFAIYSKKPVRQLERPIILALGGSTTDPLDYGHSWPEELANLLKKKGLPGTVINGGVGGQSTNQELIKLVRDGLEFYPDVIISYSGVNDRGDWGPFPTPMVHPYQRKILEGLLKPSAPAFMPNSAHLLADWIAGSDPKSRVTGFTLGVETRRTPGQWYERNLHLMKAIASSSGAKFFGIIQPNAYVGGYDWATKFENDGVKTKKYISSVRQLYSQIIKIPGERPYVHDFTKIFRGLDDVYIPGGVHATLKGNKIIAENVFALLFAEKDDD